MASALVRPVVEWESLTRNKKSRSKILKDNGYDPDPPACKSCKHLGTALPPPIHSNMTPAAVPVCTRLMVRIDLGAVCPQWQHVILGDTLE